MRIGFFATAVLPATLLWSCGQPAAPAKDQPATAAGSSVATAPATAPVPGPAFIWPASLRVMGDGYPASGDTCRRLGESDATINYLDDSAVLVGCPGAATDTAAAAIVAAHGRVVGAVDGVTLISVPQGDANRGMTPAGPSPAQGN